jgi:hypothetical protein
LPPTRGHDAPASTRLGLGGQASRGNTGARTRLASLPKLQDFSSPCVAASRPGKEGAGPVPGAGFGKRDSIGGGGGRGAPPSTGLALTWRCRPVSRAGPTTGQPGVCEPRQDAPPWPVVWRCSPSRAFKRSVRYLGMVCAVLLPCSPTMPLPECRAPFTSRHDAPLGPPRWRNWRSVASERAGWHVCMVPALME